MLDAAPHAKACALAVRTLPALPTARSLRPSALKNDRSASPAYSGTSQHAHDNNWFAKPYQLSHAQRLQRAPPDAHKGAL